MTTPVTPSRQDLVAALEPCPFCGDRMQIRHGVLRHREAGDCLIAAYTWDNGWSYKWNSRAALASEPEPQPVAEIRIVFDGFPSPDGPRFVEVEDAEGRSISVGKWRRRDDGLCELVIP